MTMPDFSFETALLAQGLTRIAGVDEVGRGPLAGPVTAAAVVLDPARLPEGLNDSKVLSARRREALLQAIMDSAEVSVAHASVEEIDSLNILRASHLAMERAVAGLPRPPDHVLIDGNLIPRGSDPSGAGHREGRCAQPVDRRRVDRGENHTRCDHVGFGATVPRLRLGDERGLSIKKSQVGAARYRGNPSP